MNRLQKKCVIASAGLHLLLALILLIGPGFLSGRKNADVQVLSFVPYLLVESAAPGGGNPHAKPPPTTVVTPTPPVAPPVRPVVNNPPAVEPAPREKPKEIERSKENSVPEEPSERTTRKLPNVSTELVKRRPGATANQPRTTAADTAAARRRAAALGQAISEIQSGVSDKTSFDDLPGPGGGGLPYAGYRQAVLSAYDRAWIAPAKIANSEAVVTVSVTINNDGSIASSRIIKRSGDPDMDGSVQDALDRVASVGVGAFPEGAKESQRTFEFDFKSRTKLMG